MLQKKEYQQHRQNLMLQKKELPTTTIKKPIVENQTSGKIKPNVTKEGITTTPTKPNVTKEGITTTTTKKPIVENQTRVKSNLMLQKKE